MKVGFKGIYISHTCYPGVLNTNSIIKELETNKEYGLHCMISVIINEQDMCNVIFSYNNSTTMQ